MQILQFYFSDYHNSYGTDIDPVLVGFSVAVLNTMTKSPVGMKGFNWLLLPGHSLSSRKVMTTPTPVSNRSPTVKFIWTILPTGLSSKGSGECIKLTIKTSQYRAP